jgi:hypothetical protein
MNEAETRAELILLEQMNIGKRQILLLNESENHSPRKN